MLVACLLCGCKGASPELGLDAWMQIEGAQYEPGKLKDAADGPEVASVFLLHPTMRPGESNRSITGALATEASAITLALDGDVGRWILVAGPPDVSTPGLPSFAAKASFSRELPLGPHELLAQAFDEDGRPGPVQSVPLTAVAGTLPEGDLIVSLSWDTNADLDLHVVDPNGVEIYKGNINSWAPPPPGEQVDPEAFKTGGMLDLDSNSQCVIDGRRQENVVWAADPPAGRYVVRVDTFSLCEEAVAHWTVDVIHLGSNLGRAQGTSTPIDASTPHGLYAGQLALEIDVP